MNKLKELFDKISIVPKVRSINGVFLAIDKDLEATNYEPYYQRNYVWDDEKASFFIETIILGSEVPPIILFTSSSPDGFINYEVIDGRQRYQTILRFLNGELRLKKSGLLKLGGIEDFSGKTFPEISESYQNLFKDTKIRTIEYGFKESHTPQEEDALKREIFQRYNSGITPLKNSDLDKAKFFHNDFNSEIKRLLSHDLFDKKVSDIFMWEKFNQDVKAAKIRTLLVLHRIPIKYYANKKQTIADKYFEHISTQLDENSENVIDSFRKKIDILFLLKKELIASGVSYNRLYAECLFWALSVMEENEVKYDLGNSSNIADLVNYLSKYQYKFTTVRSTFSSELVGRYECVADYFKGKYCCSFDEAIHNNDTFKKLTRKLSVSESTIEDESFERLRISKPEPTSVELSELLSNLKSSHFILRPPYQRAEVKNKNKSSAIIESMLLGVTLPPVFIFKRKDGVCEVIDGQQRLLSIIGFIGEYYKDEKGKRQQSKLHNFKLDLGQNAVLKHLQKYGYKDLSKAEQNKIRKTSIFIIEIREDQNPDFDPVDLFIRLNNKPYPIQTDSFEMWNSFAPRIIVQLIKGIAKTSEKWFYLRKNNSRMDNENLYSTLSYFQYMLDQNGIPDGKCAPADTIEVYTAGAHVACRFRKRSDISQLFYKGEVDGFIEAANKIEFGFITNLKAILMDYRTQQELSKGLDLLLSVKQGKRTQMSFYILWLLLHDMPSDVLSNNYKSAFEEVKQICAMTDSCDAGTFIKRLTDFRTKFDRKHRPLFSCVGDVMKRPTEKPDRILNDTVQCVLLSTRPTIANRFDVRNHSAIISESATCESTFVALELIRPGIRLRYVEAFLRSRLFVHTYRLANGKINNALNDFSSMPVVEEQTQLQVIKILDYVDNSFSIVRNYFLQLLDTMFCELSFPDEFERYGVKVFDETLNIPSLEEKDEDERLKFVEEVYLQLSKPNHKMSLYLLKVMDIDAVKLVGNS